MTAPPTALERCVGDVAEFAKTAWGTCPHVHAGEPLIDVFDVADVDATVASAVRTPELRLVRDGETLDPRRYTTTRRLGGRWTSGVTDGAAVAAEFDAGATIVLQSLHRTAPSVARFTAELEAEISHPVQANAYLTPPGTGGLSRHADGHDVLVLQLRGTKAWHIEGLGDLELRPGTAVYLPRGTEHEAATTTRASLHLTVGILRVTYRSVLRRILDEDDDRLDQPLPLGYARPDTPPGPLHDGVERALGAARERLAASSSDGIADRERRRRRPRRHDLGRLRSLVARDDLDGSSRVRLRPGPPPRIEMNGGRVLLDLGDRTVSLPATARPSIDLLCLGATVEVAELPDLDPPSQVVVARRLVTEGMLDVVDPV